MQTCALYCSDCTKINCFKKLLKRKHPPKEKHFLCAPHQNLNILPQCQAREKELRVMPKFFNVMTVAEILSVKQGFRVLYVVCGKLLSMKVTNLTLDLPLISTVTNCLWKV